MRVGVCGADEADRKQLIETVRSVLGARAVSLDSREYSAEVSLLGDVQDEAGIDVVFLLMAEGETLSLASAKALRDAGYEGELVICASDDHYAVDGYELGVAAYLVRPYAAERVKAFFDRLYGTAPTQCLTVRKHQAIIRIPYHDIMYIESNNSKCFIHRRTQGQHTVYERLDAIEERLRDDRFLRCHQSYLVNMDYVSQADSRFQLQNGECVCIRQRDHKQLKDRYLAYLQQRDPNANVGD